MSLIFNFLLIVLIVVFLSFKGGVKKLVYNAARFSGEVPISTHFLNQVSLYKSLPRPKNSVVFIGDSLVELGKWSELNPDLKFINRGVSGIQVLDIISSQLLDFIPNSNQVVTLVGINDFWSGKTTKELKDSYDKLFSALLSKSYQKVHIVSLLPSFHPDLKEKLASLREINQYVKEMARKSGFNYIDGFPTLSDDLELLKKQYSFDGVHLNGPGYEAFNQVIRGAIIE